MANEDYNNLQAQIDAICDFFAIELRGDAEFGYEAKSVEEWNNIDEEKARLFLDSINKLKKKKP